jgi:hypothetical protein
MGLGLALGPLWDRPLPALWLLRLQDLPGIFSLACGMSSLIAAKIAPSLLELSRALWAILSPRTRAGKIARGGWMLGVRLTHWRNLRYK